jgi:transposase
MAVEGATTARVFETYVERFLAPALRFGQVVVMDNLGAHRPKRIKELIEARGCELLYLPPYSPDLNPIEEAFSRKPSRSSSTSSGRSAPAPRRP